MFRELSILHFPRFLQSHVYTPRREPQTLENVKITSRAEIRVCFTEKDYNLLNPVRKTVDHTEHFRRLGEI